MATYTITIDERTAEGKNVLVFLQKSKKCVTFKKNEKLSDPTEMTKKEFYAQINQSLEQARKGQVTRLKHEDISKFLGLE